MLADVSAGSPYAFERLVPRVYDELRAIAHSKLRSEAPGHTLNTTDLVHEAYLRMVGIEGVEWADRGHYFAVCARVMRRVLLDYADRVRALKRGGGRRDLPLVEGLAAGPVAERVDFIDLDRALERLETLERSTMDVAERPCLSWSRCSSCEAGLWAAVTRTLPERSSGWAGHSSTWVASRRPLRTSGKPWIPTRTSLGAHTLM